MPNTAEQAIYNRLASAPTFHPASAKLLPTDWTLEPGDVVTVKSGETSYSVPVYSMDLTWNANSQNETCESATTRISVESTGGQTREPLPELQRKQFEQDRNAYTNFKAQKQEIDEHWQHVTQVTDHGMEDCFGVIGVKLDAQHKPIKDAQGNYVWAGPGDSPAEIWGHLHRNAWETQILNHIKDANGNIISLAEVYTDAYGNAIINAINDQRTGTATINANRIKLHATDSITLDSKLSIQANTNRLHVTGAFDVQDNVYCHNDVYIDGTIEMFDSFTSNSESFQAVTARFGASASGVSQRILGHGSLLVGLEAVVNGGQIEIKFADNSDGTHNSANFNIAATQFYIDGVAAAAASGAASHNVSSIGSITLSQSDAGKVVTKNTTVTYSNGDTTSISQSLDLTGISAGADASQINLANQQDILWVDSGSEGRYQFTSLGHLGSLIMAHVNDRGYAMFYARIDGGTGEKLYGIPIG